MKAKCKFQAVRRLWKRTNRTNRAFTVRFWDEYHNYTAQTRPQWRSEVQGDLLRSLNRLEKKIREYKVEVNLTYELFWMGDLLQKDLSERNR